MKYQFYIVLVVACFTFNSAYAMDGHNGIRFDMSQKDVEAKGFVCNPPAEKKDDVVAECQHMDMTGVAFGYPTKDYRLLIGPKKKVTMIGADFSGRMSTADYFGLHSKIEHFFPIKNEKGSFHAQGTATRDEWRDKSNTAAVLLLINGIPPITETSLSITFWSSDHMAVSDKKNK